MLTKRSSLFSILSVLGVVGLLSWFALQLEFDYEFEKFFPLSDPGLRSYRALTEMFGNDNDYLLIGVENQSGLFQQDFLKNLQVVHEKLYQIEGSEQVLSIINAKNPVQTPLGLVGLPMVHPNDTAKYALDSARLFKDHFNRDFFISKTGKGTKLLVAHRRFNIKEEADAFVALVGKSVSESNFDEYHISGKIKAQKVFIDLVRSDFQKFLVLSLLVIVFALLIIVRHPALIVATLLISILSVISILGIMVITGKKIDILSTLIPPILLIVSMSDIIHLFSRTKDLLIEGDDIVSALRKSIKEVGLATSLTSVTTMIGFLTLIAIQVRPIIDLGIYTAIGVMIAFIITYLIFPQVMILVKPKLRSNMVRPKGINFYDYLFLNIFRNQKLIIGAFTIVMIMLLWGISMVKVNSFLIDDIPEHEPLKMDFKYFDKQFYGSKPFMVSITLDTTQNTFYERSVIEEIDRVETYIRNEFGIRNLISPATYIKLANRAAHGGKSAYFALPDNDADWKKSIKFLKKYKAESKFIKVSDNKMGRIFGFSRDEGSFQSELHYSAFNNYISRINDKGNVKFMLTGTSYLIDRSNELLSLNLLKGIGVAIILVGIIAGFMFKSVKMVFITLVPNLFPVMAVGAVMGYFGIDLKVSTSIIFAISFGIAVDDTIHFISKFRGELTKGNPKLLALRNTIKQTGKPIVTTTIILSAGFLVFCISNFGATFYTGLFVGVSFFVALLADLLLLPILIWNIFPRR